jgi:hypothetical protein
MKRVGKLGIVRLTGNDLGELRRQCYDRDKGRCVRCCRHLRYEAGYWDSMHMAHVKAKRNHGDTLENVQTKCLHCHLVQEHNPKSVPRKVR